MNGLSQQVVGKEVPGEDEIDVREFLRVLVRAWPWVFVSLILGVSIAMSHVLWSKPIFESTSALYLGDSKGGKADPGPGAAGLLQGLGLQTMGGGVETQIQILQGRSLLERAILESGLNTSILPAGTTPVRFWQWKLAHKDPRIFRPSPEALDVSFAILSDPLPTARPLTVRFYRNGLYSVRLDGKRLGEGRLGQPYAGGGLSMVLRPHATGFVPAPGAVYTLTVRPVAQVYQELRKGSYKVSSPKSGEEQNLKTDVIFLAVRNHQPYMAARFLNQVMNDYLAQNLRWKTEEASATENFIQGQLESMRRALGTADRDLADYKRSSGVVAVSENARVMIEQLANYQTQLTAARLRLFNLDQISRGLSAGSGPVDRFLLTQADDRVLDGLSTDLAKAQAGLARVRESYTEAAPEVKEQTALVRQTREAIRSHILNQRNLAAKQVTDLEGLVARFSGRMKDLPGAEMQIAALSRNADVLGKVYVFLMQKQEEAALSKAATLSRNRIMDPANVAANPIEPSGMFTLGLASFVSVFLGIVLVIGHHLFSPRVQTEEEARRLIGGAPLYSVLPQVKSGKRGHRLLLDEAPNSIAAEALRLLRTNLYRRTRGGKGQVVLISSPTPGDGKTMISLNLAHALALNEKRVILVDLDLRTPSFRHVAGVEDKPGVVEALTGQVHWRSAVHHLADKSLDLIGAGVALPNPGELLSNADLTGFFGELRQVYDFIIVDSPAYPAVGDALILARHANLLLSVLRVRQTQRRVWPEHMQAFTGLITQRGVVVNGVVTKRHGYADAYPQYKPDRWQRIMRRAG